MKLHSQVEDKAILSNVNNIGEFRIRNSAKAFSILSSGLYANKIRAIIRELSCNSVDSHMAAGKNDLPYDVHLPNILEPWFSIRDYGTGLNHEEITNIYTTYFESTKTTSNDFIGALGLGCKSPFSYTNNFTVTAIKDTVKRIYTAFINEQGVPSIALMTESNTNDPNGIEVKFSVNNKFDYEKFRIEAQYVYTSFKLRPVIHGVKDFKFEELTYLDKDIIPGIHYTGHKNRSIAIMGNIAYPIDVPNADDSLGDLRKLLDSGLCIEFNIGELDFQASREGLSYIPSTIEAIKSKLELLNKQLTIHLTNEANKLSNLWDRTEYLSDRRGQSLWTNAVIQYVKDTNFPLMDNTSYNGLKPFNLYVDELSNKYNVIFKVFSKDKDSDKCTNLKPDTVIDNRVSTSIAQYTHGWKIYPIKNVHFVVNDIKRGCLERAKYHWKNIKQQNYNETIVVLEKFDKTKDMKVDELFNFIHQPPRVIKASQCLNKDKTSNKNWGKASVLVLEERRRGRHNHAMVWSSAGTASDFDPAKFYYYVEMKHWEVVGLPMSDIKDFYEYLRKSDIFTEPIYGVRQNDIPKILSQSNWIDLNWYIRKKLESFTQINLLGLVKNSIDYQSFFKYNVSDLNVNSPYYKFYLQFKDVKSDSNSSHYYLQKLMTAYKINYSGANELPKLIEQYQSEFDELKTRYPLIKSLSYSANSKDVMDYINLIDKNKGI